jgi:hypothetical protein
MLIFSFEFILKAKSLSIFLGCVIGMFPLLFMHHESKEEKEQHKKENAATTTTSK